MAWNFVLCYHPITVVKGVGRHVKNVTLPFVPNHTTPFEETGGYGQYADYNRIKIIAEERRRAWAR